MRVESHCFDLAADYCHCQVLCHWGSDDFHGCDYTCCGLNSHKYNRTAIECQTSAYLGERRHNFVGRASASPPHGSDHALRELSERTSGKGQCTNVHSTFHKPSQTCYILRKLRGGSQPSLSACSPQRRLSLIVVSRESSTFPVLLWQAPRRVQNLPSTIGWSGDQTLCVELLVVHVSWLRPLE